MAWTSIKYPRYPVAGNHTLTATAGDASRPWPLPSAQGAQKGLKGSHADKPTINNGGHINDLLYAAFTVVYIIIFTKQLNYNVPWNRLVRLQQLLGYVSSFAAAFLMAHIFLECTSDGWRSYFTSLGYRRNARLFNCVDRESDQTLWQILMPFRIICFWANSLEILTVILKDHYVVLIQFYCWHCV